MLFEKTHIDICHVATAHQRNDTRVGVKMAKAAMKEKYQVAFIVADGRPYECINGMHVFGCKKFSSRLLRMVLAPIAVVIQALKLRAKLYKIHDPELIPIFLIVRFFIKGKVVFDSHEDVPVQILNKMYLPKTFRKSLSKMAYHFLNFAAKRLDGIIAATPYIANKYLPYNAKSISICNYPVIQEYQKETLKKSKHDFNIVYVGNIGVSRGIFTLLEALDQCAPNVKMHLVGMFSDHDTEVQARQMPAWSRTSFHGWLNRDGVSKVLSDSDLGIVTLKALPNYVDALPVKLFEYMAAGLPVIASDFPVWKEIVYSNDVGVVVDPEDPEMIAAQIMNMQNSQERLKIMSANGKIAAGQKYNWDVESKNLIEFYKQLGVMPNM